MATVQSCMVSLFLAHIRIVQQYHRGHREPTYTGKAYFEMFKRWSTMVHVVYHLYLNVRQRITIVRCRRTIVQCRRTIGRCRRTIVCTDSNVCDVTRSLHDYRMMTCDNARCTCGVVQCCCDDLSVYYASRRALEKSIFWNVQKMVHDGLRHVSSLSHRTTTHNHWAFTQDHRAVSQNHRALS